MATLTDGEREVGCGRDHGRGADEDHAIGPRRLRVTAVKRIRGDRLAEHHRVRLHDSPASVALGRADLRDLVERRARRALGAAQQPRVPVDLRDPLHAGQPVQTVDVLRDGVFEHADAFELGHREVRVVRLSIHQAGRQLIRIATPFGDIPPPIGGALAELVVLIHRRFAVLRPQAVLAAERGNAGLGGDAGAGQRDAVRGVSEQLCGAPDGFGVAIVSECTHVTAG